MDNWPEFVIDLDEIHRSERSPLDFDGWEEVVFEIDESARETGEESEG
jgi:hypothetical protein